MAVGTGYSGFDQVRYGSDAAFADGLVGAARHEDVEAVGGGAGDLAFGGEEGGGGGDGRGGCEGGEEGGESEGGKSDHFVVGSFEVGFSF